MSPTAAAPQGSPPPPASDAGGTLSFYLNGHRRTLPAAAAKQTILDYLRLDAKLTGTKEGCGEGDCGACAVLLCDRGPDGALRLRAVNSCLAFVNDLQGTYALTVEGLSAGDTLHPVQDRMVALHASQCGFCTPGFVMALAAYTASDEPAEDGVIHDALAGNLCRCTGYRPIVDAAREAKAPGKSWWQARLPAVNAALDALAAETLLPSGGDFRAPRTVAELCDALAAMPEARLVAGATDLGLSIAKHGLRPKGLIAVAKVAELRRIEASSNGHRIGAAVTLSEMLPIFDPLYPGLGALLRRFGSGQIRNLATIGGNLCNASPIGDLAPVLLAIDATLHLRSASGARDVAVGDFFTGYRRTVLAPGEFLEAVTLPRLDARDRFRVYKLSKRYDQDISTVCAAIRLRVEGDTIREARIAMGGMAATPKRAAKAEGVLIGKMFTAHSIEMAIEDLAADYMPLDDMRGTAANRKIAAANLLRRFWLEVNAGAPATDVMAL